LLSYPEALTSYQKGEIAACELVAWYVIEDLQQKVGTRWLQGKRASAFDAASSEVMTTVASRRLYQFPEMSSRALCAWSLGQRKVRLLFAMPATLEILQLQARGERCVSLIDDASIPKEYEGRADFVSHDLCHLEKFYDPNEYSAQVGFFASLWEMLQTKAWQNLSSRFDTQWEREFAHIAADMNGSPIFLWASFKAALRPALHRAERPGEPFDPRAPSAFCQDSLSQVCDWFGLAGPLKDDAIKISNRQSHIEECLRLHQHFTRFGAEKIRGGSEADYLPLPLLPEE
jgi:hypothetical protein